jgi:hypothetical protein
MSSDPVAHDSIPAADDVAVVEKLVSSYDQIRSKLAHVIVGQEVVVEQLLTVLFSKGHCILDHA